MRRTAVLGIALVSGCAITPPLSLRQGPEHPSRLTLDWVRAGDEAIRVLGDYIRVDTTNPPGNETAGAHFLADILNREGIEAEIDEFAPGRGSVIAKLKATAPDGEKPFCMLSHIDVVTAEKAKWPADTPPLSGAIKDGMLWGRGTLDMKGLGALELMTMVWLHRLGVPLKRDLVFVAVADEEVGDLGMQMVTEKLWDKLNCGHLINEGGIGIKDALFEGQTLFPISVSEKGVLWLRMIASGPAGHGSTPVPGRAPERLLRAIARLNGRPLETSFDPAVLTLLRQAGDAKGGLEQFVLARPALIRSLLLGKLMGNPATRAVITNTCQVTGFAGGFEPNVIPAEVSATVDCRLLPGVKPDALLAELKRVVQDDEHIRFQVLLSSESNGSSWDDPVFEILARHAVDGRKNVAVGPMLSPGYTDSFFARPLGTRAYGYVPFEITAAEAATMHGENERVSLENIRRGLRTLLSAVAEITAAP
jgi:acetylornithine deacetylase/succinyl-diaminopimelate desuccinylase-like protein